MEDGDLATAGRRALDKLPPAWVNLLFTGLILLAGLRMLLF